MKPGGLEHDHVAVRALTSDDLPLLREMLFEAAWWRPGAPRPPLADGLARPDLVKLLADWGRAGDRGVVATSTDGPALGAAWYRFWRDDDHSYGYVGPAVPELAVGVRADARRRGVGKALLRALLAQAHADGVAAVSLSVEIDNPARRLYERLGFRPVSRVGNAWTLVAASAPQ